jgi:esterase/lipase superfamily enzyme
MRSGGPQEVAINEVILAAPDVDADTFANVAQRIEGIAKGVTLYAASNDRALIVSRNFWRNPRAGDVPGRRAGDRAGHREIDVTAASTDTFALNHSGYAENNDLLQDIGKLILSGLRPPDQRLPALKRTSSPKGDFWRYTVP